MPARESDPQRRQFLKASTGLALAAPSIIGVTFPRQSVAQPLPAFAPKTVEDRMRYFAKARASIAAETIRWWMTSDVYLGRPGQTLQPLFRTETITVMDCTPLQDGYRIVSHDRGYFASMDSDTRLESWTNPVTGETVSPPLYEDGPETATIDPAAFAGMPVATRAWERSGNLVNITNERIKDQQAPKHFALLYNYWSSYDELVDPKRSSAATDVMMQFITNAYLPWMKMGDQPGFLYSRRYGTKASSSAVLDEGKFNRISSLFPGTLEAK